MSTSSETVSLSLPIDTMVSVHAHALAELINALNDERRPHILRELMVLRDFDKKFPLDETRLPNCINQLEDDLISALNQLKAERALSTST